MAYFGILVKVLSADILRSKHGPIFLDSSSALEGSLK
jgi:hypothetical protein